MFESIKFFCYFAIVLLVFALFVSFQQIHKKIYLHEKLFTFALLSHSHERFLCLLKMAAHNHRRSPRDFLLPFHSLVSNLDCVFVITLGVAFGAAFGAAGVEGRAGRSSRIVAVAVAVEVT